MSTTHDDRAKAFLIASVVVTLALYFIPYGRYIAYPLMLLSTLAHEMGHGIAAVLVGADFESFKMWSDGSGVALWRGHPGRLASGFVAAGGLVGPAIVGALCFALARRERIAQITLSVVGALCAIAILLVVRNLFGVIFVAAVGAACIAIAVKAKPWIAQVTLVFLGTQLALSVFSRGDYLFTDVAHTAKGVMPSDVAQISDALILPYWFWGALCGLFSVVAIGVGLRQFFKAR